MQTDAPLSSTENKCVPTPPEWLYENGLYRAQVREVAQYAIFSLDVAGIVRSWNAGVQRILGYAEAEWVGQDASIIFTPQDQRRQIAQSEMRTAAERGHCSDVRWHVRKDGTELFGNGCMTALRGAGGALIGFTKIFSDETESKKLQDSLTESNAALEQFAYIASHDLQEPLRTMAAYSELLGRRYRDQLDEQGRAFLDVITQGSQRMSALVQDLLIYARVRTEVDRPFSYRLDEDLETAISQLQTSIEESHAVVTHDPLPEVQADQGQIVRLFQNLVGNALKYRKPDTPPIIHIAVQPRDAEWIISVTDNGIGFDPRYAQEIFTPFKRLHSRNQFPGTGVGLAICRRIVENHGGRIWAESTPGQGSTFYFSLPTAGKAPPKQTPSVLENL